MSMSSKHEQFVNEYLSCFNGTDAYIAVYGPVKRTTAAVNAAKLLAIPSVSEAIKERLNESGMTSDEVLMRLAAIARGDIGDYLVSGSDGVSIDMGKALAAKKTGLVKRINQKRTERTAGDTTTVELLTTIELHDPLAALQLIGKHHKLFTEKAEVSGPNGGPIEYKEDDQAGQRIMAKLDLLHQRLSEAESHDN